MGFWVSLVLFLGFLFVLVCFWVWFGFLGFPFLFYFCFFGSWFLIFCGFDSLAGSFLGDSPKPPFFSSIITIFRELIFPHFPGGFLIALQAACGVLPHSLYFL